MSLLFDRISATLERHLDFRLERANMIAANLANVDTPGYTPVELKFDQQLERFLEGRLPPAVRRTDLDHRGEPVNAPPGDVEFDFFALPDATGNSVDLDHEMAKLSTNQGKYRAAAKVYSKRMALLKYAITEGGR